MPGIKTNKSPKLAPAAALKQYLTGMLFNSKGVVLFRGTLGWRGDVCVMLNGWLRKFHEAIEAPDGPQLNTMRDAVAYLAKTVPKSERDLPAVTMAAEVLTYATERGIAWMFLARMAV